MSKRSWHGIFILFVALIGTALALAGCGSSSSESSGGSGTTTSGGQFVAHPEKGVNGGLLPDELKLWKYNFDTGHYEVVPGDASKPFKPDLRKPSKPITIAYDDGYGGIPFTIAIKENLERIAGELGITINYCDEQDKAEKAIECAEEQVVKHPDFAIESNFQSAVRKNVMEVWNKAKVPVVNVDEWHPNGIFFGANDYEAGLIGGQAAGEFAKKEWNCEDLYTLVGESPAEGHVVSFRVSGFLDGVQEICGELPGDHKGDILLDAGTADQAITKTTDWLTANPQATHILAASLDSRVDGMAKAFVQAQREGYAVGQGCDEIEVAAIKEGPASSSHFLGCVAYFPEKYPEYLVTIALDVLEGKPVPQEVHIKHEFLDQENIDTVYP